MEQSQTEVVTKRKGRRSTPKQIARQKWRLCAAVEYVCAVMGTSATVADALKQAGMSRRSFYEFFDSLDDICEAMQIASREHNRAPHAPFRLLSLNPCRDDIDAASAFSYARSVLEAGALEVPDDESLLAWGASINAAKAGAFKIEVGL